MKRFVAPHIASVLLVVSMFLVVCVPATALAISIGSPAAYFVPNFIPNANFTSTMTENFTTTATITETSNITTSISLTKTENLTFTSTETTTSTVAILPTDTGAYGITAIAVVGLVIVAVLVLRKRQVQQRGPAAPAAGTILCPSCHTPNKATATFCRRCRTRLR